jgi:hypothetical protein
MDAKAIGTKEHIELIAARCRDLLGDVVVHARVQRGDDKERLLASLEHLLRDASESLHEAGRIASSLESMGAF